MEDKYICASDKLFYGSKYIALSLEVEGLPEKVSIQGMTLQRKSSFHCSLLCVNNILGLQSDLEDQILTFFCSFAKENDISFVRYTGEFRYAVDGERRSLIALCEISNLAKFSNALGEKLGMQIPEQPTHVTLYTLQPDAGIGLNSREEMETKSTTVIPPEEVRSAPALN